MEKVKKDALCKKIQKQIKLEVVGVCVFVFA